MPEGVETTLPSPAPCMEITSFQLGTGVFMGGEKSGEGVVPEAPHPKRRTQATVGRSLNILFIKNIFTTTHPDHLVIVAPTDGIVQETALLQLCDLMILL